MDRSVQYELMAKDPARATKFYRDVFGWRVEKWAGPWNSWMITTGPGTGEKAGGGLSSRLSLGRPPVNTVEVASLEEAEVRIKAAGGQVLETFPIAGVGLYALWVDTEGNRFGLYQANPEAR
ncbi:MAG TPA: VOC family protein [Acidobacteriota bacterium]|nr:VOC family protein [Acidobacteriota bacterium]